MPEEWKGYHWLGALLLVQLAGFIVPFVLLLPIAGDWQDTIANATAAAPQVRIAVGWLYANGALTVAMSILLFPVLRRHDEPLSIALVVAGALMLFAQAVDNAEILSLLSLAGAGASAAAVAAAASARSWTHNTAIVAIDAWLVFLYLALWRTRPVPRAMAGVGLLTVVLHFVAIPMRSVLGLAPIATLGMPMGVAQLVTAGWLLRRRR